MTLICDAVLAPMVQPLSAMSLVNIGMSMIIKLGHLERFTWGYVCIIGSIFNGVYGRAKIA